MEIGRWYDFRRLPGRARSHTTANKWETFRLHGTLAGHRAAYTDRERRFVQPRRLRPVESDAWWTYEGPLAIVFTGLADGALVLPVRLPTHRRTSRSSSTTWPIRVDGTRSTWSATAIDAVAGATRRT